MSVWIAVARISESMIPFEDPSKMERTPAEDCPSMLRVTTTILPPNQRLSFFSGASRASR